MKKVSSPYSVAHYSQGFESFDKDPSNAASILNLKSGKVRKLDPLAETRYPRWDRRQSLMSAFLGAPQEERGGFRSSYNSKKDRYVISVDSPDLDTAGRMAPNSFHFHKDHIPSAEQLKGLAGASGRRLDDRSLNDALEWAKVHRHRRDLAKKVGLGVAGAAALAVGAYGVHKYLQHRKNKKKVQDMKKMSSATVLAFMDEMEKIADTGPNMFVESMKARASRQLSHVPDIARSMGTRALSWAKKQPGEIVQGLRQGAGAVASPVEAVSGGLSKKVSPLRELFSPAQGSIPGITTPASNILQNATLGRVVSGGLAARGLYQSGKGLVGAVRGKEDPTGRGRSRLARGLEAGGHLAGSLAGAYAGRNLGALGGMAAGIVPQVAGAMAGRAVGAGIDRLRGHRAQPQQMG